MFAPTNTAAVFADLISDEYAFSDVALRHGTTAAELAAWLQTPAIAEQFSAITAAVALRTRAVAIHALHNASKALRTIVEYFNDVQMHCVYNPANPKDAQRRLREFNTVRRASWLLYLISRTAGLPPRDRPDRPDRPDHPARTPTPPPPPPSDFTPREGVPGATPQARELCDSHEPGAAARASPAPAVCDSYEPEAKATGCHAESTETRSPVSTLRPPRPSTCRATLLCDSYEPGAAATGSHAAQTKTRIRLLTLPSSFGNLGFGNLALCDAPVPDA